MRTLKGQNITRDENVALFPDGQIVDDTATQDGTPVVRKLYGDIVTNIYKILRDAGVTPNELEDSENSGYQLLKALKLFHNELNDLSQTISVSQDSMSIQIDLSNLPDNYVFIGKVDEAVKSNFNYSLDGLNNSSKVLISQSNIKASSTVLLIIKNGISEIVSINSQSESFLNVGFGTPISFNDSSEIHYYEQGNVFNDFPKNIEVQNIINVFENNLDNVLTQVIIFKGRLICMTFNQTDFKYKLYSINLSNTTQVEQKLLESSTLVDNQPYLYCNGEYLIITNSNNSGINTSLNDYDLVLIDFDEANVTASIFGQEVLENRFEKTTNVFATQSSIYTFLNGNLYKYDFDNVVRVFLGNFKTIDGVVFHHNGSNYYSNGNTATQWQY